MRDTIMRGVLGGIIGGIPAIVINQLEHKKGLIDMTYPKYAASLMMNKKETKTIHGKIIGNTVNTIGLAVDGVATSYLLKLTGRDYAIAKGIGVSLLEGVVLRGIWPKLGLTPKIKKARSHTLSLVNHLITGALSGYVISKLQEPEGTNAVKTDAVSTGTGTETRETPHKIRIKKIKKTQQPYLLR